MLSVTAFIMSSLEKKTALNINDLAMKVLLALDILRWNVFACRKFSVELVKAVKTIEALKCEVSVPTCVFNQQAMTLLFVCDPSSSRIYLLTLLKHFESSLHKPSETIYSAAINLWNLWWKSNINIDGVNLRHKRKLFLWSEWGRGGEISTEANWITIAVDGTLSFLLILIVVSRVTF